MDTSTDAGGTVRFDDVVVRLATREVVRAGEPQHLEPQAFDLLAVLIAERDRVVPKEELLERVWGDQFVSESALTTRIKELRRALGDDGNRQAVIRNHRGHGYRFAPDRPVERVRPSGLYGRDELIRSIQQLIGSHRLVTLVGPGGVGKTALARAVTADLRHDDLIVVQLAPLRDGDAVAAAVQRAADVSGATSVDAMLAEVARRDATLLLDNGEHLVAQVAELTGRLLAHAGALRVLTTSRERLGVSGEQVVPVRELDRDAARALFIDRARRAEPAFEPELDAVDRLVEAVDRLPLAIEMAAARVRAVGIDELTERMTERTGMLRSPDRAADDRHRTLAAVVEWSEELLDDGLRATFHGFGVFAGRITADDVEGVLGADAMTDVVDLVDKSLIVADTADDPTTYRMLSTVRTHASVAPSDPTRRAHAAWFTEVAERCDDAIRTPDEIAARRRLDRAADELRAAHRWARDHDHDLAARMTAALDLHAHSRPWAEPATWAEELLAALAPDHRGTAAVSAAIAADAAHRGDYDRARTLAGPAVDATDSRARASALETLSDIALYDGDLEHARVTSERLRDEGRSSGDRHAEAIGVLGVVLTHAYDQQPAAAAEALATLDERDLAPSDLAWLHYARGETMAADDPGRAATELQAAIGLATECGNGFVAGVARVALLSLRVSSGDTDAAAADFAIALRTFRRAGAASQGATALRNLVVLLAERGDDALAMQILGALSDPTVKPTFGDELRRVAEAGAAIEERAGHERSSAWRAEGEGRGVLWALDAAIEHLTAAPSTAT